MVNLGRILELYDLWNLYLPQIKPFYAVKSNHDRILLKILATLGFGFDCASKVKSDSYIAEGRNRSVR